jgi:hypothetical protein
MLLEFALSSSALAVGTANGRAILSNNTTTPQVSAYTASNTFAAAAGAAAGAIPSFMVNRSCTTQTENIIGYVTTAEHWLASYAQPGVQESRDGTAPAGPPNGTSRLAATA